MSQFSCFGINIYSNEQLISESLFEKANWKYDWKQKLQRMGLLNLLILVGWLVCQFWGGFFGFFFFLNISSLVSYVTSLWTYYSWNSASWGLVSSVLPVFHYINRYCYFPLSLLAWPCEVSGCRDKSAVCWRCARKQSKLLTDQKKAKTKQSLFTVLKCMGSLKVFSYIYLKCF